MSDVIQISTTAAEQADVERIAEALVFNRLAACAQVSGPVTSIYHWQGGVERSTEWRCTVKTLADRYQAVERAIREIHPYDVPEILAVPVVAGAEAYVKWLRDELAEDGA